MFQTETLLLVVLGFSLATLIALFVGRLMWGLAIRVGSRRMQRQIPSTTGELHTERDRLRAEYALLSQKLSARLESSRMKMAEQMAEVTRTRNRIETLVAEINEKDTAHAAREQEVLSLRARLSDQETAIADAQTVIADQRLELDKKSNEISELHQVIAEKDAHIATLAPSPEVILSRLGGEADFEDVIEHAAEASPIPDAVLQQHLAETAHETEDLQSELHRLDATWTKKLGRIKGRSKLPAVKPAGGSLDEALGKRIKSLQKDVAR
jgi:chromosome segregation ATPase